MPAIGISIKFKRWIELTGFVKRWQFHLHPRISSLVPEYLSISRRYHVRNDGEAGIPWWAWGGGSVAADVGCVVCDDHVEVVIAAYISSDAPDPLLNHTSLKQRVSRLGHLRRTRVPGHRTAQQQRLHEAQSVIAQDPPWQRHVVRSGGMTFRKCGLRVRFSDVAEYVKAAVGAEVAAVVRAVALDTEDVGGWGSNVGDVGGEEGGWGCL